MPPQHKQAAYSYDAKKILRDLEDNNKFFDDLVNMIPAKLYVAGNTGDEMYNTKYGKGQHKESKEARRGRNKASCSKKFDPSTTETTLQAQRRIREERDNELDSDDDDDDDDDIVDDSDGEGQENPPDIDMTDNNNKEQSLDSPSKSTPPYQSHIETLRAKLHAKIEAKRPKRTHPPADDANSSEVFISKRAKRRAEKQRRVEISQKKKNAGGSTRTMVNGKERANNSNGGDDNLKEADLGGSKLLSLDSKASGDDLAGIDFGGIAGLKDGIESNYTNANKSLKNMGKKKSLVGQLAKAAYNSEKLQKLKASDDLDDKARVNKVEWNKTIKAASGDRSKNEPAILKKAIKRIAKKKAKSQATWKKRMDHVKGTMDDRQKIRQHNIGQRKLGGAIAANLSKKRIDDGDGGAEGGNEKGGGARANNKRPRLGPHSGNARAGFEGKKQDFINKGGKNTGSGKKA